MSGELKDKFPLMKVREIMQKLPHRYPFLLIDKILEINEKDRYVVALKNVTFNEPQFQGHFPDLPLLPGVLIIEAMAQTGALWVNVFEERAEVAALMSVKNAKFRKPVIPGETIIMRVDLLHMSKKGGRIKGVAHVEGKLAAEAEIGFVFLKKSDL